MILFSNRGVPGCPPRRIMFRGKMRDPHEIAAMTGFNVNTIYKRLANGTALDAPRKHGHGPMTIRFRGRQATLAEISNETGLSKSQVSKRHNGYHFFEDDELNAQPRDVPTNARILFHDGIQRHDCRLVKTHWHQSRHDQDAPSLQVDDQRRAHNARWQVSPICDLQRRDAVAIDLGRLLGREPWIVA